MPNKMIVEISECCDAATTFDVCWKNHICVRCGKVCDIIEIDEELYDEIAADDERGQNESA